MAGTTRVLQVGAVSAGVSGVSIGTAPAVWGVALPGSNWAPPIGWMSPGAFDFSDVVIHDTSTSDTTVNGSGQGQSSVSGTSSMTSTGTGTSSGSTSSGGTSSGSSAGTTSVNGSYTTSDSSTSS